MRLTNVKSGSKIFIDANIFIYHFTGVSDECSNFLIRCEQGDLAGITSVNVILEVLHRLMMVEAVRKRLVSPPNIAKKLERLSMKVRQLNEYFINTQKIIDMGIKIKPLSAETILKSQAFRAGYGLMVNDSVIVASMQEEGIKGIATNDEVFLKIKELSVYKPADLKI